MSKVFIVPHQKKNQGMFWWRYLSKHFDNRLRKDEDYGMYGAARAAGILFPIKGFNDPRLSLLTNLSEYNSRKKFIAWLKKYFPDNEVK